MEKKDGRKNNGGKGGRKKIFEEGSARISVSVPKNQKKEYTKDVNTFIREKYKSDKNQ